MLRPGTEAPEFTVALDSGETFRLSESRGKKHLVIYFFPKAFTKG